MTPAVVTDIAVKKSLKEIALAYAVKVTWQDENYARNMGACVGREIFLGDFDCEDFKEITFFHELGHVLSNELVCKRGRTMTQLSSEGLAWELGLGLAFEHGYQWEDDSRAMKFARESLETYRHKGYRYIKKMIRIHASLILAHLYCLFHWEWNVHSTGWDTLVSTETVGVGTKNADGDIKIYIYTYPWWVARKSTAKGLTTT